MLDGLKQVDECFVAGDDALGSLAQLDVKRVRTWELEKAHTARRIARPMCIAFTGENGCEIRQRCESRHQCLFTYQTNVDGEGGGGRKLGQD
jgi:hypothetical protein